MTKVKEDGDGGGKKKRLSSGGRKPTSEALEEELCNWIEHQRSLKNGVSRKMMVLKAKEVFDNGDLEITKETFRASRDWLQNFMKRHDMVVRKRTTVSQKLPSQLVSKLIRYVKVF